MKGSRQHGAEIRRIAYGCGPDGQTSGNVVDVTLRADAPLDLDRLRRHFAATSSCGVCGKASIEAVSARGLMRPRGDALINPERLCALPDRLRPGPSAVRKNRRTARGRPVRPGRSHS